MNRPRSRLIMMLGMLLVIAMITAGIALAADRGVWAPNVAYAVNDTVTYQDASHPNHQYKVLQAHTSQVGWEPPNTPALFQDLGPVGSATTPPPTTPPPATPPPTTAPPPPHPRPRLRP